MGLKAGVKVRWELPRQREEKGIPGDAKVTGKGVESGMDTMWEEQEQTLGFSWLGKTLAQREVGLPGK